VKQTERSLFCEEACDAHPVTHFAHTFMVDLFFTITSVLVIMDSRKLLSDKGDASTWNPFPLVILLLGMFMYGRY